MKEPPISSPAPAREVPVEALPPDPVATVAATRAGKYGPPIHSLSALLLVAVDSLWVVFDWAPPLWIVAIPLCFLAVFVPSFLVQKHLKRDSTGRAAAFATLLAVLAAIPTPVTGTPVGLALLAWSGFGPAVRPPRAQVAGCARTLRHSVSAPGTTTNSSTGASLNQPTRWLARTDSTTPTPAVRPGRSADSQSACQPLGIGKTEQAGERRDEAPVPAPLAARPTLFPTHEPVEVRPPS